MRALAPLVLASLLVAGCSNAGDSANSQGGDDPDPEFGVKATPTTGVIRGVVLDAAIRPLAGAVINLTTGGSTVSGDDGAFGFQGLEPGEYFLQASKKGFESAQTSARVEAGIDDPPITKILLVLVPSLQPYVDAFVKHGYLGFGVAIGITSIGSTFLGGPVSETLNDAAVWNMQFTQVPMWAQGELVWDQTQPGGGMLIFEMVRGNDNNIYRGYRETSVSPALAYWNTTVLQGEAENVTDPEHGIDYRFFGGPHPMLAPGGGVVPERGSGHPACTTVDTGPVLGPRSLCAFGYGTTLQQRADAYIHNFYNFAPPEGWRFTVDGEPVVPDE